MRRSPAPAVRAVLPRAFVVAALALLAAASGARAQGPSRGACDLWADYEPLSQLVVAPFAQVREAVVARRTRDPDDFMACWLPGIAATGLWTAPPRPPRSTRSRARRMTRRRGHFAATRRPCTAGAAPTSRREFERAHALYRDRGRVPEAVFALLWRSARVTPRLPAAKDAPWLARAESLAVAAGDAALVASVRMEQAERLDPREHEPRLAMLRAALAAMPDAPCLLRVILHRQLALRFGERGRADSAGVHAREAVREADRLGSEEAVAMAGLLWTSALVDEGRLSEADSVVTRLLARSASADSPRRAAMLYQQGRVRMTLHRLDEAETALLEATARFEAARGSSPDRVSALEMLAAVRRRRGDMDGARGRLEQALAEARRQRSRRSEAFVHAKFAMLQHELGDFDEADSSLARAIAAGRAAGLAGSVAGWTVLRADLAGERGDVASAIRLAAGARELLSAQGADQRILPLAIEARWLAAAGRTGEARARLDTLLALRDRLGADPSGDVAAMEGEVRAALGDHAGAARVLRASLAGLPRDLAPGEAALRLRRCGSALLRAGAAAEAAVVLDSALVLREEFDEALASSEDRAQLQSRWHAATVDLALARVRAGRAAAAFACVDRSRSRELRRTAGRLQVEPRGARARRIARELAAAERALVASQIELIERAAAARASSQRSVEQLQASCAHWRARRHALARELQRASPADARERGLGEPTTVAALRARLAPGEGLLAWLVGEDRSLVFAVTRERLVTREVPWGEGELAARVRTLNERLRREGAGDWSALAAALADTLLPEPAALAGVRAWHVVPDGALGVLPLEVLRPRDARGERQLLVERASIAVLEAPSSLPPLAARPAATGPAGLVAFGDPATAAPVAGAGAIPGGALPYARREVEAIAALWPGARVHVGADATESRFLAALGSARVLHVAAHGFVDDHHPDASGLVLAADTLARGRTDGLAQAWEVARRRGRPELVVLSACESGGGRWLRGEGLLGLARAFRLAGARQVLASLWKVDDAATADFMLRFHRHLRAGLDAREALARTKRESIAGPAPASAPSSPRGVGVESRRANAAHPSAWAAFVLRGAPR